MLKSFDAPVMEVNCERRPVSTVATQSLMLMNSDFIVNHARHFAERIRREAGTVVLPENTFDSTSNQDSTDRLPSMSHQIVYSWQLAYGRSPTGDELTTVLGFVVEQYQWLVANRGSEKDFEPGLQVMTNLCHVLLSSNEFLYVD